MVAYCDNYKGRSYVIVGQSLGYDSCLPISPVGRSIPGRCYRVAGAVFGRNPRCAAPSTFSPALPGRAESPALLVPGTSLCSEQWWEAGKHTQLLHNHSRPCRLPTAPLTATWQPWGFFLSVTDLFSTCQNCISKTQGAAGRF